MPYGHHIASSAFLDVKSMTFRLDLLQYCKMSGSGKDGSGVFLLMGCFLSVLSQALMAIALNGEKERVTVHEEHEVEGLMHSVKHDSQSAMKLLSAAAHDPSGAFGHAFGSAGQSAKHSL